MRPSRGRIITIGLIVLTLLGFVFLRGPTPHISIKPETLTDVGPVHITNTMITSWLVVATIIVGVFLATRRWEIVPRGVQNVIEAILEAFYSLVVNVAGEKNGRRFFPVVATIFFLILASNWLSLLPVFNSIGVTKEVEEKSGRIEESGFVMKQVGPIDYVPLSGLGGLSGDSVKTTEDDPNAAEKLKKVHSEGKFVGEFIPILRGPNTDLNTPLALAIASAIAVETWGITSLGLFTYGRKFFNFGGILRGLLRLNPGMMAQGMIDAFVGLLELISETVRLVSFTFRLFGNMLAGEVVILMFTFLTPLVVTVAMYGLELFVGVIQAFIFAMLTLVFGVMAVTHGEHGGHEEEAHISREQSQESNA